MVLYLALLALYVNSIAKIYCSVQAKYLAKLLVLSQSGEVPVFSLQVFFMLLVRIELVAILIFRLSLIFILQIISKFLAYSNRS